MSNEYFNFTSTLARLSRARSAAVNAVFAAIAAGFEKLPTPRAMATGMFNYAVDEGATDAYAVTLDPELVTTYAEGMQIRVRVGSTNTGPCTLEVNGLGPRAVKRADATDPLPGDIVSGSFYEFVYTGTVWQLTSAVNSDMYLPLTGGHLSAGMTAAGAIRSNAGEMLSQAATAASSAHFRLRDHLGNMFGQIYATASRSELTIRKVASNGSTTETELKLTASDITAKGTLKISAEADGYSRLQQLDSAGRERFMALTNDTFTFLRRVTANGTIGPQFTATDTEMLLQNVSSDPSASQSVLNRQRGDARYTQISSTLRFKEGVRPVTTTELDLLIDALGDILLHVWTWGGELSADDNRRGLIGVGAIAEHVHDALPAEWRQAFVAYEDDGRPYGLYAHPAVGLLIEVARRHKAALVDHEGRIAALEAAQ